MLSIKDSQDLPFRSVLPHEPLPEEDHGYLHIQGSFEPKKPKKEEGQGKDVDDDENEHDNCYFWTTPQALHDAILQSPAVQNLHGILEIELLDRDPPFTKIRFAFQSPLHASEALQSWRRQKMRPVDLLVVQDQTFASRQFQMSQITKMPMLSTAMAWTRSNPPKFRRLLSSSSSSSSRHSADGGGGAGTSLEEERLQARFVFLSHLIPENDPPPTGWNTAAVEAIRAVMNEYDSTGYGVEVFVPHKSDVYQCHVGMRIPKDAQKVIAALQGTCVQWKISETMIIKSPKLFLDYADITQRSVQRGKRTDGLEVIRGEPSRPDCTSTTDQVTVPGLHVIPEFVSPREELVLMAALTGPHAPWAPSQVVPSKTGSVRRRVQHYGYVFDYETADVLRDRDPDSAACPPLPTRPQPSSSNLEDDIQQYVQEGRGWETLAGILERTRRHEFGLGKRYADINQITVNEYRPGEGIGSHVDTPTAFGDGLMSLSLNSGIVMEFRKVADTNDKKLVYLPARSLLVLTGPARYEWEHMIVTRRTDTVNGVVKLRGLRLSLTLRTALQAPSSSGEAATEPMERVESCVFPPVWRRTKHASTTATALVTPETERQHVHAVYDAIATQWHHTRGKRGVLWPGATQFLMQLPSGSIVADVGCGDGKYFPAIWEAGSYVIGTDISLPLLLTTMTEGLEETTENRQVSAHRTQLRNRPAVAVADCMTVPLRDKSVDAAICIAVLHHLSTPERRHRCLSELVRIVKRGGLINVQAWAMEQDEGSRRKFASSDVFVPFNAQPKYLDAELQKKENEDSNNGSAAASSVAEVYAKSYDGAEYDERKGLVVFQRYCHLYREGELEALVASVRGVEIVENGYQSGNHFLILRVLE